MHKVPDSIPRNTERTREVGGTQNVGGVERAQGLVCTNTPLVLAIVTQRAGNRDPGPVPASRKTHSCASPSSQLPELSLEKHFGFLERKALQKYRELCWKVPLFIIWRMSVVSEGNHSTFKAKAMAKNNRGAAGSQRHKEPVLGPRGINRSTFSPSPNHKLYSPSVGHEAGPGHHSPSTCKTGGCLSNRKRQNTARDMPEGGHSPPRCVPCGISPTEGWGKMESSTNPTFSHHIQLCRWL